MLGLKIERLRSIDFNSKSVYGDNDKYIKGKIKTFADSITTNFYLKKTRKKTFDAIVYQ